MRNKFNKAYEVGQRRLRNKADSNAIIWDNRNNNLGFKQ